MYLRIKRRFSKRAQEDTFTFEIVRSARDEITREPRTQVVAYLGSLSAGDLARPIKCAVWWRMVDCQLLSQKLTPSDEEKIRSKLLAEVPRPTAPISVLLRARQQLGV